MCKDGPTSERIKIFMITIDIFYYSYEAEIANKGSYDAYKLKKKSLVSLAYAIIFQQCKCKRVQLTFAGPGRYSDRSLFRQVDIPTGRYSDRSIFRQTGRYSDRSLFRQTGRYSDRSLFRQVDSPTNRSIFREFYIPTNRSIF